MSEKVIWHLRMDREGRTCLAKQKTATARGGQIFKLEAVRMQERLVLEYLDEAELRAAYPIDLLHADEAAGEVGTLGLKCSAHQYLIHAAVAGASHEAVALLVQICRPKQALRERIEANYTD